MNALGWLRRSAIHAESLRDREAVRCADHALALAPSLRAAQWNRGICLLRLGEWVQGWQDFESGIGIGCREQRPWRPRWGGVSSVQGKTVYVWSEQGLGDTIHFLRFLRPFRERFQPGRVILEVQPPLYSLLHDYEYADEVRAKVLRDPYPPCEFDVHCSLMSLPAFLKVTL